MEVVTNFKSVGCRDCRDLNQLGIEFTMAFQPIVNFHEKSIFGYEALVSRRIMAFIAQKP